MKRTRSICSCVVALLVAVPGIAAGGLELEAEGGGAWFSRNDARIPSATGTDFDMRDLTGSGPDPYARLHATWAINTRHALRLTYAPLIVSGVGTLGKDVTFAGELFDGGEDTKGTYRFNTYRLTYRWTFHRGQRWRWGVGATALVRDAEIRLEQGALNAFSDDLGFVPLLHLYGAVLLNERVSVILDIDAAGASQGRAVDGAVKVRYDDPSGWFAAGGYRTLEGGADAGSVYTFAWVHFPLVTAGYSF